MAKKWTIITLLAALSFTSCDKPGASAKDLRLLTESPWKYEKAGFATDDDDEGNGFDALDPRIAGCEKDNSIIFRSDGTGMLEDGKMTCKVAGGKIAGGEDLPFVWSFQNKDSTIYFQDRYYKIKTLTNSRFVIYADQKFGASHTRYTIVMKH